MLKWKSFRVKYRRITWSLKNRPHIYIFCEKFLQIRDNFCIMILIFSPYFICVLCRAKILPQIYTRIIASLKPPHIYAHYMREKFRPDIYEKSRRGRNDVCEIDWALVSWRSFVSRFVYAVIVWIRSFLLIGWCQSLVVKVWWNRINSL